MKAALTQPGTGLADGTLFYSTLYRQAAVLMYQVTKSHACIDGNKRIGVVLMLLFVEINGWKAFFPEPEVRAFSLYVADSAAADRATVLEQLSSWIGARIQRARPPTTGAIQ